MKKTSIFKKEAFGDKLRMLRKEHHLTQIEAAKELGLSQSALSLYENGMHYPTEPILNRISEYFDVSVDYLSGRTCFREDALSSPAPSEDPATKEPIEARTICDAVTVLLSLLDGLPERDAAEAAERSLETLLSQLYWDLARVSPGRSGLPTGCEIPGSFHELCGKELSMNRAAYTQALTKAARSPENLPDCGGSALKSTYPNEYQSLFQLLRESRMRVEKHLVSEEER